MASVPKPNAIGAAMLLGDFFRDVYTPARMGNANGRSLQQLQVAISRFEAFIGRQATLADLTEDAVIKWMNHPWAFNSTKEKPKRISPSTTNSRLRELKTLWRYAVRKRFIIVGDENNLESVERFRVPKRNPRAWSIEEMARIVKSSRMAKGRFMGIPANLWWPAFLLLLYDTGLRLTSAMGIRFEEIDFNDKLLCVPPERMKNNCEQYYWLHDQTIEAILETIPPRRAKVFPFPFDYRRALYGRYRVILRRAGLPSTKLDMFHKIRRTTASHVSRLLGEQAAIRQLGHQDASCIRRYVDPRFTNDHMAAQHLPRPAWNSPKILEVETTDIEPAPAPLPPVSVRYSSADLRGEGADVFQQILDGDMTGPLVAQAVEILGIRLVEFAAEVGMNKKYVGRILAGKTPLCPKSKSAIRRALGITFDHSGEGDRSGESHAGKAVRA